MTSFSSTSISDASVTLIFSVSAESEKLPIELMDNSRACHVTLNTLEIPS
jgi:hypothetical protein